MATCLPEINRLKVEQMRPRSNSDSKVKSQKSAGCEEPVPEITVEDFSDKKLQLTKNTNGNINDTQEMRRRSYTCPEDMFRPNRDRPPTPPPKDGLNALKSVGKTSSREKISFVHHTLGKVSEDNNETRPETPKSEDLQKTPRKDDANKRTAGLSESG